MTKQDIHSGKVLPGEGGSEANTISGSNMTVQLKEEAAGKGK